MAAFPWPAGRTCALSMSFDDARPSQLAVGAPILGAHGVRATFFVSMDAVREDLAGWRALAAAGHEIGNHTRSHPCSGNFPWARQKALEDFTLERMEAELVGASADIAAAFGAAPRSFAYCCGQTFVGRGERTRSFVPLVARHFLVGRSYRDEHFNDPGFVDLARIAGTNFDALEDGHLDWLVDATAENGWWLALAGHDIGEQGGQTVRRAGLERLLGRLAKRPEIWVDTVGAVAAHIARVRPALG